MTRDQCGSRAGYMAHRRSKEKACPGCREANATYYRAYNRALARLREMYPRQWCVVLWDELQRVGGAS